MKFTLLLFCIFAYLLLFFVAGSSSGVANLCEEGKFFDSSKQKYKSCLECKSDMQECYSCCQTEVHGKNMKISSMFVMSSLILNLKVLNLPTSATSKKDVIAILAITQPIFIRKKWFEIGK